jgi:hypothetical protein
VDDEVFHAEERGKAIIPLWERDGLHLPFGLEKLQAISFANYEEGLKRLLHDLEAGQAQQQRTA